MPCPATREGIEDSLPCPPQLLTGEGGAGVSAGFGAPRCCFRWVAIDRRVPPGFFCIIATYRRSGLRRRGVQWIMTKT